MGAAAAGFIGYAVIFLVRNFTDSFLELGIGPSEVNVGKEAIQNFSPSLFHYISHLHIAVAGFIAATGVAVLFLVAYGVRRGELWAWVGAVTAPVIGLLVALPAHYPNHFDTLGHLGLIYLATLVFVAGALVALRGILTLRKGLSSTWSGGRSPRRPELATRGTSERSEAWWPEREPTVREVRRGSGWLEVRRSADRWRVSTTPDTFTSAPIATAH